MDLLCLKLKKDLKSELDVYTKEKGYPVENLGTLIDDAVKPELFHFKIQEYDETKCQARLWSKGLQCDHSKTECSDYCNKHQDMIRYYGTLRFGDIKDKKPKYDLIKLKDGEKERLNWIEPNPLIRLENLLDKQQQKMINTHTLVVK
tara:strand:- start:1248 stop:1688 length:441 start_codon:yes stop_codon:yes gene_type:complete